MNPRLCREVALIGCMTFDSMPERSRLRLELLHVASACCDLRNLRGGRGVLSGLSRMLGALAFLLVGIACG
jgi:hypothetical protein